LEHIFEPFFTTKPVGEGTGLGLAVVHGVMKSHAGAIVVESRPGEGTSFRLFFPIFDGKQEELPEGSPSPPMGKGEHILLVDDEEALTQLGIAALQRLGYHVTAANTPGEAFELFSKQPKDFDLVLTDLNMPGMSGTALAQKLRAIRPDLRMILASGFNVTVTEEVARETGFSELLPKPYDLNTLGAVVHRTLN